MVSTPLTLRRAIARGAVLLCSAAGALSACGLSELSPPPAVESDAGADATSPPETGTDAPVPAIAEDAEASVDAGIDASVGDADDDAFSVDDQDAGATEDAGSACGSCTTPPTPCFTSPGTCNGSVCAYGQPAAGAPCGGRNLCDGFGSCGACTCAAVECSRGLCTAGANSACAYVPVPAGTKCGFLTFGQCDGKGKCSL